jgi:hypothetical protein
MWSALSDKREGLLFAGVSSNMSVVGMYNLHFNICICNIYKASVQTQNSRLCPVISSYCYKNSLDT